MRRGQRPRVTGLAAFRLCGPVVMSDASGGDISGKRKEKVQLLSPSARQPISRRQNPSGKSIASTIS